jgi:predicted membrane protein
MKRDISTIVIGALFLLAGVAIGGSMLGLFNFTVNLDGWWTVFIIVPALIAIAQGGLNAGNIIMLGVGVVLLLNAQGILPHGFSWRLIFPVVLLGIGVQLLLGNSGSTRRENWSGPKGPMENDDKHEGKHEGGGIFNESSRPGKSYKTASSILGGQDIFYGQEEFSGASYTAVLGGLSVNLTNVILTGDVTINVTAIMGGIDLILPAGVQVISNVTPILGGTEIKYPSSRDSAARKIYITGAASLGGIEIK